MPTLIPKATRVLDAGSGGKTIDEFVGHLNNGENRLSVAQMNAPKGWTEPGQRPEFDEYTLVLSGELQVESEGETLLVRAGQAILTQGGEWVRYSTPTSPASYIAICLPAFSPDTVHRDED